MLPPVTLSSMSKHAVMLWVACVSVQKVLFCLMGSCDQQGADLPCAARIGRIRLSGKLSVYLVAVILDCFAVQLHKTMESSGKTYKQAGMCTAMSFRLWCSLYLDTLSCPWIVWYCQFELLLQTTQYSDTQDSCTIRMYTTLWLLYSLKLKAINMLKWLEHSNCQQTMFIDQVIDTQPESSLQSGVG